MKIIAFDNFKLGVTIDDLKPYIRDEVSNVWRLWKAGIVRENYARADVGGVIVVFELDSVEDAKRYTTISRSQGLGCWNGISWPSTHRCRLNTSLTPPSTQRRLGIGPWQDYPIQSWHRNADYISGMVRSTTHRADRVRHAGRDLRAGLRC